MKIYRRENVPCVSQTKYWKGLFEEHFLSVEEINIKYPILNPLWRFVDTGVLTINNRSYSTIYCAKYFDFHQINQPYTDPWYRELKHDYHIYDISEETAYLTTVESNAVVLRFEKNKTMNDENDNQYGSIRNQMMDDPETIRLTVNGVDLMVNKSHQYIGCLQKDVAMPRFVKVVLYLRKEGFLDEPED